MRFSGPVAVAIMSHVLIRWYCVGCWGYAGSLLLISPLRLDICYKPGWSSVSICICQRHRSLSHLTIQLNVRVHVFVSPFVCILLYVWLCVCVCSFGFAPALPQGDVVDMWHASRVAKRPRVSTLAPQLPYHFVIDSWTIGRSAFSHLGGSYWISWDLCLIIFSKKKSKHPT